MSVNPSRTYEVLYWAAPGRGDIIRMMLYIAGAPYRNVFVSYHDWPKLQEEQRFGHIPKLTICEQDGTTKELWETSSIELYLAETLGFLPAGAANDPFARAECLSFYFSLLELYTNLSASGAYPTPAERFSATERERTDVIPLYLAQHEKIVIDENRGPFYCGDKVTLPDLMLLCLYLNFAQVYKDKNPINSTDLPRLTRICETTLLGKAGEYANSHRDFGAFAYSETEGTWVGSQQ